MLGSEERYPDPGDSRGNSGCRISVGIRRFSARLPSPRRPNGEACSRILRLSFQSRMSHWREPGWRQPLGRLLIVVASLVARRFSWLFSFSRPSD